MNQLDRIEEYCQRATGGPWWYVTAGIVWSGDLQKNEAVMVDMPCGDSETRVKNAEFISNSRTDLPRVVKALRVAMATLDKIDNVTAWAGKDTISAILDGKGE